MTAPTTTRGIPTTSPGMEIHEALRTRAFWYFSIASTFHSAGLGAVLLHIMPYLTSVGMDRATAGMVVMLVPLVSLGVRFPAGLLADIFPKRHVMGFFMLLKGVGLFLFYLISGDSPFWLLLLFAIGFGCGIGGITPTRSPFLREYFGTRKFGTILGLTSISSTIGGIISPTLTGWVFDTFGVYGPMWLILSGATIAGGLLVMATPAPSGNPEPST